ncbi:cytidine deaminase [Paludibacterium paludis]|uniref:Cytidine deaminase n=1 Tax=Paludibacterium paludis TaxID=1225769 RepID=A0A918P473_9NEIS|nr:cytidine deaminase [Paludibacterium paludis]GGY20267.1 cytidine deaminase [Paludibacterium paludis]
MSERVIDWAHLEREARAAAARAYVPYSRFAVGAAILTADGRVFTGCNVENASFGLTNCAERTAVFTSRASGDTSDILAVCVYTPTDEPTPPCGACRQVLNEFGPTMRVRTICRTEQRVDTTLDTLLPGAFGPRNLDTAGNG